MIIGEDLRLVPIANILPEALLTLLACERHLHSLLQGVLLALRVALGAVKPLFAARAADRDLRIEDVLAVCFALTGRGGYIVEVRCGLTTYWALQARRGLPGTL